VVTATVSELRGVFGYEFRMQIRRPAVWIALATCSVFVLSLFVTGWPARPDSQLPLLERAAAGLTGSRGFLPIVFGILLADRLPRERRLRTGELFDSLPIGNGVRLWGKYLGSTTATVAVFFLFTLISTAYMAVTLNDVSLIPAMIPVFAVVELPGLFFIGAFSIACTEFLPTPLYAILFIGYWPWGNLFPPGPIPNLSCTPLTAIGRYASIGFFNQDPDPGKTCGLTQNDISVAAAIGSIVLVSFIAALAMLTLHKYTNWRTARR
jgi:ABC-2 type transport system permease protein